MDPLVIAGVNAAPGTRVEVNLSIAKLYDFTEIQMPIKIVAGKEDGPRLFVCAAIHGDEIIGVEIIKRLLKHPSLKKLKGTLIAVPIVNVFGFNSLSRYLPDRRDLNRSFPGSEQGSLAARLAHTFIHEVVEKCTHGVDLHTGAVHRMNLPQIRVCMDDAGSMAMASAFGVPVMLDADIIEGSLRQVAHKRKIPFVVYEGGEALRYDEFAIKSGLQGTLSVMRSIGMLPPVKTKPSRTFQAKSSHWVRAPHSGILRTQRKIGSHVQAGDLLGVISNPFDSDLVEVHAKEEGIMIGQICIPLVNRGDALFHIATFHKPKHVMASMELMEDRFDTEEKFGSE